MGASYYTWRESTLPFIAFIAFSAAISDSNFTKPNPFGLWVAWSLINLAIQEKR